jgi:hypothetical protein
MTTISKKITNYELRTTNYIVEGNLIAPDLTAEMLAGTIKGQAEVDFNFAKTDKLADEIAIAWGDAKAYWTAFQRAVARLPEQDLATTVTREQWVVPLLRSLGYDPVYTAKAEVVDGQTYALSHRAGVLQQSKVPDAALAITNYELRITNYELPSHSCRWLSGQARTAPAQRYAETLSTRLDARIPQPHRASVGDCHQWVAVAAVARLFVNDSSHLH